MCARVIRGENAIRDSRDKAWAVGQVKEGGNGTRSCPKGDDQKGKIEMVFAGREDYSVWIVGFCV